MMREINFRGRDRNKKWHYGWLVPTDTGDGFAILFGPMCLDEYQEVDPETVGQFTTQTDNNGEDIYEGDILRVGSQIGTVVYDCDSFEVAFGCGNTSLFRCLLEKPCLVIGNIHDNPDLLEAEGNA